MESKLPRPDAPPVTPAESRPRRPGRPVLEILLLIGLPLAVVIAGAITIRLSLSDGFTAQKDAPRLVVPH